jgi:glycogen synthase
VKKNAPLRLFYAAGPGNVIQSYHFWKKGIDDPNLIGFADSSGFYEVVKKINATALVISSYPEVKNFSDSNITIINMPKKVSHSGVGYHIDQIIYGLKIFWKALRFRADVAFIDSGTTDWFICTLFPLFGISVIPALKCALWENFKPLTFKYKILNFFDSFLFSKSARAIITISLEIDFQLLKITNGITKPIIHYIPTFKSEIFQDIPLANPLSKPFNVVFIGRLESPKGIFDIIKIAKDFKNEGISDIHFHFCGTGSAEKEMKKEIASKDLTNTCFCHGYCGRDKLKEILVKSHVMIVPSKISEGYPAVVAEAIAARRPVVTSAICPALFDVKEAVAEAQPNDVQSYKENILKLYNDPAFYISKQHACELLRKQFFDLSNGWQAALEKAISLSP